MGRLMDLEKRNARRSVGYRGCSRSDRSENYDKNGYPRITRFQSLDRLSNRDN